MLPKMSETEPLPPRARRGSIVSSRLVRSKKQPPRKGIPPRKNPSLVGQERWGSVQSLVLPTNEYTYSPIANNEFRLLRLQPASQKRDGIVCFLETTSIYNPGYDYDALSYTWGSGDATQEIKVQTSGANTSQSSRRVVSAMRNVISPKAFYITRNLEEALRRFRDTDETVILWIDALCINQKDKDEKGKQVARMAEIYSRASCVLIWLGDEYEDSQTAIDFVGDVLDLELLDDLATREQSLAQWDALAKLMRREWFTRRWVVQELAMAKEASVYAGEAAVHWDDFAEAVALFVREFDRIANGFKNSRGYRYNSEVLGDVRASGASSIVTTTNQLFRVSGSSEIERLTGLESLVSSLLIFESSDPRDTVYGLLSMAKDISQHPDMQIPGHSRSNGIGAATISADYSKNTLEVMKDFIAFCIESSGSMDMICRHWAPNTRRPITITERADVNAQPIKIDLPSWISLLKYSPFGIPRTAVTGHRVAADDLVGHPDRRNYNAARGTSPAVLFGEIDAVGPNAFDPRKDLLLHNDIPLWSIDDHKVSPIDTLKGSRNRRSNGCLFAKGYMIDQVNEISPRMTDGMIHREGLIFGGWSEAVDTDTSLLPNHLWRTLVADRGSDGSNPPRWYRRAMLYCLRNRNEIDDIHIDRLLDQEKSSSMIEFLRRVLAVVWNKRLFLSCGYSKYRFGLAPNAVEVNDIVCILLGCSVPVVLRKHGDGSEEYYEFIGEAYIYGMMDGEALEQYASLTAREFRLR